MQLLNSKILSNDKNTRYSNKKAQDTRVTCAFCLLQLFRTTKMVEMRGFALQRLLPKVNRVQPKGFTRQCRVAVYKIAINPRFDDIKKQVEQGSTCLLCGGDAGIWTPVHPTVLGTFYTFSWWLKFFLLRFTYKPCFDDLVITTILPRNRIALSVFLTPIAEGTENLRSTCWLNYAARANSIEELFWLFFAFNFNVPF